MIEIETYQYARGPRGRSYHCVTVDANGQPSDSICHMLPAREITTLVAQRPEPLRICRLCRRKEYAK